MVTFLISNRPGSAENTAGKAPITPTIMSTFGDSRDSGLNILRTTKQHTKVATANKQKELN